MYLTRLIRKAEISDVGELIRESRGLIFFRLGDIRPNLSPRGLSDLELQAEMAETPIIDCDQGGATWPELRQALADLGKVFAELDDSQPFFVAVRSSDLRAAGPEEIPYLAAFVESADRREEPSGLSAVEQRSLDCLGDCLRWIETESPGGKPTGRASRTELLSLLIALIDLIWK